MKTQYVSHSVVYASVPQSFSDLGFWVSQQVIGFSDEDDFLIVALDQIQNLARTLSVSS